MKDAHDALCKLGLGIGQMFGAALSLVLLVTSGVSDVTLAAVAATCVLTTVSVLVFGRHSHHSKSGNNETGSLS